MILCRHSSTCFCEQRLAAFATMACLLACCAAASGAGYEPPALQTDVRIESPSPPNENADSLELPTIEDKVKHWTCQRGLFDFYWDEHQGKIWLEVSRFDQPFLYYTSLSSGLGSNPVGLDRGKLGAEKIVHWRRIGRRLFLVQPNLMFRASSPNLLERRAVQESFASSILWAGDIEAESPTGAVLVDLSSLLLSDPSDIAGTLSRSGQGRYALDAKRSAIHLDRCRAFPQNIELDAFLTFQGDQPSSDIRQTTPTPTAVTLQVHHSLVGLPDESYQPRRYDVRCPSISISYADYSVPLNQPLERRFIIRHRLEKRHPQRRLSEPVEPIVYWVDPGAPQPIRDALIEGASWWNTAFESAGFKNAFQVKVLPADVDPLDVRYNVIQWVHRSTRGWSYGSSVIDPRTGEILKGHVTLGSLRVRQDRLLVNSLQLAQATAGDASGLDAELCGSAGPSLQGLLLAGDDSLATQVALARIRQLSAHEVGHTLGFVHNFAASTYGDRASVMDYPAPRIRVTEDNQLDFSDAYGVGIGDWDRVAVRYAYEPFADAASEQEGLDKILQQAREQGMVFISDADSRPASAAHPLSNLWDNGSDPSEEFEHVMRVRRIALDQLDPAGLSAEVSAAELEQYLVPVYLHHRYQVQALGKVIGGARFHYGKADPANVRWEPAAAQWRAAELLIDSLHPQQLAIPERIRVSIAPQPVGSLRDREAMPSQSGRMFDPLAAARVATELVVAELLNAQRLNRVCQSADPEFSAKQLIDRLVETPWKWAQDADSALDSGSPNLLLSQVVRHVTTQQLAQLVDDPNSSVAVRSAALAGLEKQKALAGWRQAERTQESEVDFCRLLVRDIEQVLQRKSSAAPQPARLEVPPGSPIGGGDRK